MALSLLVVLPGGCAERVEEPPDDALFQPLTVGEAAPAYRVITPAGDSVAIGPGQGVTLLNLWATWCGPCLKEFPDIEQLHRELGPRGLRVVAVDVEADPPETVTRFAANLGVTFTVALDPAGAIEERYQSMGLPSSYLIGPDGLLLARWTGVLPPSARETIEAHLTNP
jgi:thiol-disulfide isomerase/thioredoxin